MLYFQQGVYVVSMLYIPWGFHLVPTKEVIKVILHFALKEFWKDG